MSNSNQQIVHVHLRDRSYPIFIEPGLIDRVDGCLDSVSGRHLVLITDQTVDDLYSAAVISCLSGQVLRLDKLVVAAGEMSKSVEQLQSLWQQMIESGSDRSTIVVALGGGVIGDLAGFVAASLLRGLELIQIPTTLLAQVDSSVGGKVGINLPQGKNLVGAFWQPRAVLIDPAVLRTLDERNYRAGLAEVVKYAVILDEAFFGWLEKNSDEIKNRDPETLKTLIARCCQLKAEVVSEDERETSGRRVILNYGHTLGHAIENNVGYGELLHGEAISIGMAFAGQLALQMGRVDREFVQRQMQLLENFGLPTQLGSANAEQLLSTMQHDKKSIGRAIRFVLPTKIGHVELVSEVSEKEINTAIKSIQTS
jgi:3-dehydroquinate synthase